MHECTDCGSRKITTVIEHELLLWGSVADRDYFECDTPVRACEDCGARWIDSEGMDVRTLAQFKLEKSKSVNRTKFCSENERRLWEQA